MDIVTMNILNTTMISICREMGITLMKTAYSTIFNEALDFSCGLADKDGNLIAAGEFCPAQIGAIPTLIHNFVQECPKEDMKPGDIIMHNDPYRGGLHIPEHTLVKPIFYDGEIVAYAISIGHVAEIGGKVPGGFASDATEIFQEGIRIPPVKIVKEGKDDVDLWKLYMANVRTPRYNYGDIRALISSLDLAEKRLTSLIDKYGVDVFLQTAKDLMEYSERRMRAEIAELPDGEYEFEDCLDDDGVEDKRCKYHVKLFIKGDEIVVDFHGTDKQVKGAVNATYTVALAATYNTLLHVTDPTIPRNSGCFKPVHVLAPAGTIANVDYPGAEVGGNTEGHPRLAGTVMGAFSKVCPDNCMAAEGGTHINFVFGGYHEEYEEPFSCYSLEAVGWGGRPFADGNTLLDEINGNCRSCPTEVFETRFPWIVEEWKLYEDSGGAGKYRGGLGGIKTYLANGDITCSQCSDRHKVAPYGLFGGMEGGKGGTYIKLAGTDEWGTAETLFNRPSSSKYAGLPIHKGDRVKIVCPGGGGYGNPLERDKEAVEYDLAEGFISEKTAREIYKL